MLSDILSDSPPDILSGISSDILSGISSDILSGISSDILSGVLSGKSSASRLRSGREHWPRMVAVDVRRGTLATDGRG